MKQWFIGSLAFLLGISPTTAFAQDLPPTPETLTLSQTFNDPELATCTEQIYTTLMTYQITEAYHVLPLWYVAQYTATLSADDPELFQKTFEALPELNHLIVLRTAPDKKNISALWVQRQSTDRLTVKQVETVAVQNYTQPEQRTQSCLLLAQRLYHQNVPERFRSPFLSAGLSLMIPGAGHFYRNTSEGLVWGSVFLLSYLSMSFLALSERTPLENSQWGALILGVSLVDALSAYFLTQQSEAS